MALIPPFFVDCIVAIGTEGPATSDRRWIASGFFYGKKAAGAFAGAEPRYWVYLVTNRHVLSNKALIYLRCNPMSGGPACEIASSPLVGVSGSRLWVGHPDPSIDVAVLPVDASLFSSQAYRVNFFKSDEHALMRSGLSDQGISEGDFGYVAGFPLGEIGLTRSTVIVRSGCIARITDMLEGSNRTFLVDSSVFPGNSGGPVLLKPELTAIAGTKAHDQAMLIGIVAAYVPYSEVAISQQTGMPRVVFQENSGLATVYPVDCIEETITEDLRNRIPALQGSRAP